MWDHHMEDKQTLYSLHTATGSSLNPFHFLKTSALSLYLQQTACSHRVCERHCYHMSPTHFQAVVVWVELHGDECRLGSLLENTGRFGGW